MGRNDGLHIATRGEPGGIHLLVARPAAAGHHHHAVVALRALAPAEGLQLRYHLRLRRHVGHAVEARVAGHRHVGDAYPFQKLDAAALLHEDMAEAPQPAPIPAVALAEETLLRPEVGAHQIGRDAAPAQLGEIVAPDLVFHEYGRLGAHHIDEAACRQREVEGEIAHYVGPLIAFAHLVARGGEEGEDHLQPGATAAYALYDGASLLELTERGGVDPYVAGSRLQLLPQRAPHGRVAAAHQPGLGVEGRGKANGTRVCADGHVVDRIHL